MSANLKEIGRTSVRDRVGGEEWRMRVDLAAACQLASLFRWTDRIYTHFSARVPGSSDFLINAHRLMFDEITASNLVRIDHHGSVLEDPTGMGYDPAGFVLHSCVHEARPEAQCVIHTHTRSGVEVAAMKCGLLPISQHAMLMQRSVTYHDYEGIALDTDERSRLAKDLGTTAKAMILRNHGLLTLGASVGEAWETMYYLECACQIQVDACAGGLDNVMRMSEAAAVNATRQFHSPRPSDTKTWPALLRMLDRRGVAYRD